MLRVTDPSIWASPTYINLYRPELYVGWLFLFNNYVSTVTDIHQLLVFLGIRKPFFLAEKVWKDIVWPESSRTIRESLIDELVFLPEILCACSTLEDKLKMRSPSEFEPDILQGPQILRELRSFEVRLNSWYQELEREHGTPLKWNKESSNPVRPPRQLLCC